MADYTFPSFMPKPLQSGFSMDEEAGFITSQPASGAYYAQIISDDLPTYFNLTYQVSPSQQAGFLSWLRLDNKAVKYGAQFNIDLPVGSEYATQVAHFTPDGIPKLTSTTGTMATYSMTVCVPRLVEPGAGSEELIIGVAELGGNEQLDVIVNTELPGAE